jgi:hypothetical protein
MELDFRSFAFIISLAAVINGLGIVRLLGGFAEYLRRQDDLEIAHYWVFNLWAVFQFLLHILMWWTLWGVQTAAEFTFLHYLYLLSGPILLFLGTSLLVPNVNDNTVDLYRHFYAVRVPYFTVASLLWLWAIFANTVFAGDFAPAAPIWACYLALTLALRFTSNPKIHAVLAIGAWALITIFVANFAMGLRAVAAT